MAAPYSHPCENGSAAVELAIILPILVLFLTFPIFFARCFWHYTVAQKAAQDTVRYLSSIPQAEMRSPVLAAAAAGTAMRIATTELAELNTGRAAPTVEIFCGTSACTGTASHPLPTTVRVLIKMYMFDSLFGVVDVGRYGVAITADAIFPYVGQ